MKEVNNLQKWKGAGKSYIHSSGSNWIIVVNSLPDFSLRRTFLTTCEPPCIKSRTICHITNGISSKRCHIPRCCFDLSVAKHESVQLSNVGVTCWTWRLIRNASLNMIRQLLYESLMSNYDRIRGLAMYTAISVSRSAQYASLRKD